MSAKPLLLCLAFWLLLSPGLFSQTLPRKILALYDSQVDSVRFSPTHTLAEMPLNHLGMVLVHHDIHAPLPDLSQDPEYRGILTWFHEGQTLKDPKAYLDWAVRMVKAGKKFVILGDPGFYFDAKGNPVSVVALNRFFREIGIVDQGSWEEMTYKTKVESVNPKWIPYERHYKGRLPAYNTYLPANSATQSHLVVVNQATGTKSHLILTSPKGGLVAKGYGVYQLFRREGGDQIRQWYINPFGFFRQAFDLGQNPIPDTTTLVGRRIYYSHIDGDGWNNYSQLEEYSQKDMISAQVVLREVIRPFPGLPVSVAPIAADLDSSWVGSHTARMTAQEIFAENQVEMASHTYSHPFEWGFFAGADPEKERPYLPFYPNRTWGSQVSLKGLASRFQPPEKEGKKGMYELNQRYDIPRAFAVEPFDITKEVEGSVEFINRLAPPGKRVKVIMWSGNTSPYLQAMELANRLGIENINGGDSRYDREFPSVGWVSPLGIQVGPYRQVFASNSNENTYTDLWTNRYYGFRYLIHTLENTERPLRLKPINIYYHIYSGEKRASLNALLENLRYAKSQEICPLFASQFAQVVKGFYDTKLEQTGPQTWKVKQRGQLQTLRFDQASLMSLNLGQSVGVLGQRHSQGNLYVFLDPAHPEPVVSLQSWTQLGGPPGDQQAYLISSRWPVWGLERQAKGFVLQAQGFGQLEQTWQVPKPGRYLVLAQAPETKAQSQEVKVGPDRILNLRLNLPFNRPARLEVKEAP